jgi:membrane protein DedA with SNARE-associated domain
MESLQEIVTNYGYWAVFLGSLVEGESVILTASAFARNGTLSIYKVVTIAFIGTTIADQLLYWLGWHYGDSIFNRFSKLKEPSEKAFRLLKKYDVGFIIACRFIYGIRVASAIAIGAAKIPPKRFVPLNILSAAIWSIVSCSAGYALGILVLKIFDEVENFQKIIFWGLGGIAVFIFITLKLKPLFFKKIK